MRILRDIPLSSVTVRTMLREGNIPFTSLVLFGNTVVVFKEP